MVLSVFCWGAVACRLGWLVSVLGGARHLFAAWLVGFGFVGVGVVGLPAFFCVFKVMGLAHDFSQTVSFLYAQFSASSHLSLSGFRACVGDFLSGFSFCRVYLSPPSLAAIGSARGLRGRCSGGPTPLAPDKSGVVLRFWVGFTPLAFLAF